MTRTHCPIVSSHLCLSGKIRCMRTVARTAAFVIPIVFGILRGVAVAQVNTWTSNGPEGGAIGSLAMDPITPTTLYAGTQDGGISRSTDGGGHWTAINTGLPPYLSIHELVVDPASPTTVYAATWAGVFKTENAGVSWSTANVGLTNLFVPALVVNPTTPATLYAGTVGGGVFRTTNGGGTWAAVNNGLTNLDVTALAIVPATPTTIYAGTHDGMFKSVNGGESWTAVNTGLPAPQSFFSIHAIALDPSTPGTLYIGTWTAGVFKSTDSGDHWSAVNAGLTSLTVADLAIDPAVPTTIYAGIAGGVVKSTNGGGTWSPVNNGLIDLFGFAMAIDPSNPATLYLGTEIGVFKSSNAAASWSPVNSGLKSILVTTLAVDSLTLTTVYAGTSTGAVFKATDGGTVWSVVNTGLSVNAVTALVIDPVTAATVYIGTEDVTGIFKSINGGGSWSRIITGLTDTRVRAMAIDPVTPTTLYAATFGGGVFKTTNGGANWVSSNSGLSSLNVTALAVDPLTPATVYAGTWGFGVFRSTNGGASWSAVNCGLTVGYAFVRTLVVDPATPTTLYAGMASGTFGGVFRSTNSGGCWSTVNDGLTDRDVRALAMDPTTPTTLYAGTSNTGMFRSADAGVSWAASNLGLTNLSIYALGTAKTPLTSVYAGTLGGGVFKYVSFPCSTIMFSPATLAPGTAGAAYANTTITQTGGMDPTTFVVTSGALPSGVTLSSAGVVSGTPNVVGTFAFTVVANDSNNCPGSRAYSLAIACPTITLSPMSVSNGTIGGAYTATTITQSGGVGPATFAVTSRALPTGMTLSSAGLLSGTPTATGTFNFTVTATDTNGCTGARSYTLTIECPIITVSPTSVSNGTIGGAYASTTITQSGGVGPATFAVTSGALPSGILLSSAGVVSGAPTAIGTFSFTVTATDANGCTGARSYSLTIAAPSLTLVPSTVSFSVVNSAGTLTVATPAQTLTLAQANGWVAWTAAADQSWITLSPTAGTGSGTLTVAINNTNGVLPASGIVTGTITVTPTTGADQAGQVGQVGQVGLAEPANAPTATVRLSVRAPAQPADAPFGVFDTPVANTTIQGSIAVTGWALDDVAIDRVEIWRDLSSGETTVPFTAPGHPGNGKVFIATPLFITGARPDVEAAYPTHPFANRAGWGYLLLTWGLWNQGNGPVTLYAFAYDQEGNATTLGTKSVTSDNAHATKPFGALDVPTYGQTVTTNFWNYGWALTPNANSADSRTCTITNANVFMAIDSGPLVAVNYGDLRTDIAASFPGFSNGTGAGGAYFIDIAPLASGTHSIGWFVVDSCGRADGIGSRFFTVGVPIVPVTITFGGLSGNGSPFTTYHESGFTVSPTSGSWTALTTYGKPAPSIIFRRLEAEPTMTAEMQITAGGSAFSFSSVDLYSSVTPIPYTITGLMSSTPVFTVSDTVPNTFGNFATVLNQNTTDIIDTLLIRLSNPATPCCSNPVGLDNIVLRRGATAADEVAGFTEPDVDPPAFGRVRLQAAPDVAINQEPVALRRMGGDWALAYPSAEGMRVVTIAQDDRIEIRLPTSEDARYSGYLLVNGDRRALPLGSSLDAEAGIFYWQPAAGFLGSFDLMFTVGGAGTKLRVVVGPSMRMTIDTPTSGTMVPQPFTIAGWALDLAATEGAGIDTVHVWAYPAAGGDPIFLGVADSGDSRPDVAETYGGQFERSSFSLMANALPPGTYDVVVYAHRGSTGTFEGAQSVRVVVP